ncbi:hypothetical protein HN014_18180 [Aquimarina sp. TRL1]|uniref:hypothetical protein n=1 Tax=Aquimarina sp. (strain TRL1) TaxID=2736252 RepID=UPI0015892B28|nr:hypothetical protein [Aquimarina sp. TRL1]QKX06761.1 hypothetical protein HN014_18180 [Aquimarina sp. TRL1]
MIQEEIITSYTLESRETLKSFESEWSLTRVKKMTLEEYVSVDNRTTFCYWVETKTRHIGSIKGSTSIKFGIYKPNKNRDINEIERFTHDEEYVWSKRYGNSREEVFRKIKSNIIAIIENTQSGNFRAIDTIDISHMFKWKIAFLYSKENLLPIYKKDVVIYECLRVGINTKNKPFSYLIDSLYTKKPKGQSVFDYMGEVFSRVRYKPNYYLLESNYEQFNGNYKDVLPLMLSGNVISVGFEHDLNLEEYIGDEESLKLELESRNVKQSSKNELLKFIKIRPGDIIGLKKRTNDNKVIVNAYALVLGYDDEVIYSTDKELVHCLKVDFFESDVNKKINVNRAHTMHEIEKEIEIETIFGSYGETEVRNITTNSLGVDYKKERKYEVTTQARTYIVNSIHDKLQNQCSSYLKEKLGNSGVVKLEKDFIDIKVNLTNGKIQLYEVKPYQNPSYCIREALGQLLYYASRTTEQIDLIAIVGPNILDTRAQSYFDYVKRNVNFPFEYISANKEFG